MSSAVSLSGNRRLSILSLWESLLDSSSERTLPRSHVRLQGFRLLLVWVMKKGYIRIQTDGVYSSADSTELAQFSWIGLL